VARLTDSQADSLIAALTRDTGVYAVTSSVPTDPSAWHPAEGVETPPTTANIETDAHRLRAFARDAAKTDELGRTLTLDLAAYLRRPVRCSLGRTAPTIASPWRFGAKVEGGLLWADVDSGLGSAFADAMIGGDGAAPIGRGRKVRGLAAISVKRMLDAFARAAGATLLSPVESIAPADEHGPAIAGGLCAVAVDEYPWAIGVAVNAPRPEAARPAPVELKLDRHTADEAKPTPVDDTRRPLQQPSDPDEALRNAIDALGARIAELTRSSVVTRSARIERIDGSDIAGPPAAALGLALTAGGNGAVVAFADAGAVAGIAGATAGIAGAAAGHASTTMNAAPGEVAIAATEAVIRAALERAVVELPALGDEGHRVVRLSDDPLTARTPHHAVDLEVSSAGKTGMLRVLVPSWMLVRREKKSR